jgi:hypothetical protein
MKIRPISFLYCTLLLGFIGALFVLANPGPTFASQIIGLNATPTGPGVSSFTIRYSDNDNSGLFNPDNDTVLYFSNMTDGIHTYSHVVESPLAGYYNPPCTDGRDGVWAFANGGGTNYFDPSDWLVSCHAAPLPPSLIMLGSGLIGLAVARRQKWLG